MAKETKTSKTDPNPDLRTTTKKSLDSMSEQHRRHIERWEPFLASMNAEHVWAATPRFLGRGDGPFFVAVKVGAKNYSIIEYDTSAPKTKALGATLVEGTTSPKVILEQFKEYRQTAKAERDALRKAAQASKAKASKPAAKKKVVRKTSKAS